MKKKFSKILGVGLTLALLTSLLLTVAPVSAITQPSVTLSDDEISATNVEYSIIFAITEDLDQGEDIIIEFPDGTDITAVGTGDVLIGATSGIGSGAFADAVPTAVSDDGQELTITLDTPIVAGETKIGVGATVQVLIVNVDNPDDPDDYTLEVSTTDEAAVTSASYEIIAPTIGALPGIVSRYNSTGILMEQYTGNAGIQDAIDESLVDYVIKIGPGTYVDDITVDVPGLTLVATGDAEDTIIQNETTALVVASGADEVTISGLTFQGEMVIYADGVTIEDCIFEKLDEDSSETLLEYDGSDTIDSTITNSSFDTTAGSVGDDVGLYIDDDGLVVSDSSFTVDEDDWGIRLYYDATVKDSTFTGSSGIGIYFEDDIGIITGNTFDGLENAIYLYDPEAGSEISGNTIMNSTGDAIYVYETDDIIIVNNTITDTDEDYYALYVADDYAEYVFFLFNNVTGNDGNVYSEDTGDEVNATHNWWGDAAGPASGSIAGDGDVDTSSYLGAPVTSAAIALGVDDLDAEDSVGVSVEGATGATIIGVASYGGNPQEAIADALTFFDVFVAGATVAPTVKFYAGNADTVLNAWSVATDIWVPQTTDFSAFGGYVYATISLDLLEGTPIALIDSPVADTLDAPVLASPVSGDVTVSLTPTFSWGAVTDADAYYFQIADNPAFLLPLASLTGDLGRLLSTTYAQVADLDYSDVIYWRVKAVSGTTDGGDLIESIWADDLFTTMEEPLAEVWMSDDGLTFDTRGELEDYLAERAAAEEPADIIVEVDVPDIIVPLPAETPITPGWIYAIIGIGAVLVIALIVLIVRTRRVA